MPFQRLQLSFQGISQFLLCVFIILLYLLIFLELIKSTSFFNNILITKESKVDMTIYSHNRENLFNLKWFYKNNSSIVPNDLWIVESRLLCLEILIIFHGLITKRKGVLVGIICFGFFQEFVGFFLGAHYHGQFYFQVVEFLPLKELFIYLIILYPPIIAVETLAFEKAWANGVMMALLVQLGNAPYDFIGSKLDLWIFNKDFPWINFEDKFDIPYGVYFSWLSMGFTLGFILKLFGSENQINQASFILISAPLSGFPFIFYHFNKFLGCSTKSFISFFEDPLGNMHFCIRSSSLNDSHIWAISFFFLVFSFPIAWNKKNLNKKKSIHFHKYDWLILSFLAIYYWILFIVYSFKTNTRSKLHTPALVFWGMSSIFFYAICFSSASGVNGKSKIKRL